MSTDDLTLRKTPVQPRSKGGWSGFDEQSGELLWQLRLVRTTGLPRDVLTHQHRAFVRRPSKAIGLRRDCGRRLSRHLGRPMGITART